MQSRGPKFKKLNTHTHTQWKGSFKLDLLPPAANCFLRVKPNLPVSCVVSPRPNSGLSPHVSLSLTLLLFPRSPFLYSLSSPCSLSLPLSSPVPPSPLLLALLRAPLSVSPSLNVPLPIPGELSPPSLLYPLWNMRVQGSLRAMIWRQKTLVAGCLIFLWVPAPGREPGRTPSILHPAPGPRNAR